MQVCLTWPHELVGTKGTLDCHGDHSIPTGCPGDENHDILNDSSLLSTKDKTDTQLGTLPSQQSCHTLCQSKRSSKLRGWHGGSSLNMRSVAPANQRATRYANEGSGFGSIKISAFADSKPCVPYPIAKNRESHSLPK